MHKNQRIILQIAAAATGIALVATAAPAPVPHSDPPAPPYTGSLVSDSVTTPLAVQRALEADGRASRTVTRAPLPKPKVTPHRHKPVRHVARELGSSVWDRLAYCESTGNWHINTGNGFYGGTQTSLSTWKEYGGLRYAKRPDLASRDQQILVNKRILKGQGWKAWPACSKRIGMR